MYLFWRERWDLRHMTRVDTERCNVGPEYVFNNTILQVARVLQPITPRESLQISLVSYSLCINTTFSLLNRDELLCDTSLQIQTFQNLQRLRLKGLELRVPSNRKEREVATRLSAESWWQTVCHNPSFPVVSILSLTQNQ